MKNYVCALNALMRKMTGLVMLFFMSAASAQVIQFNSTGGSNTTNGLKIFISDTSQLQVNRFNSNSGSTGGQVYSPNVTPPNASLDNGVFLRANNVMYGPAHNVGGGYNPAGGNYNSRTWVSTTSPANPSSNGVQQTATMNLGVNSGPQVNIVWKYTTPLDFLTAEVTVTIPAGFPISASNPVRYYHVVDTYLGGSDNGCGFVLTDSNSKRVIGTYPPPNGTSCPSSTSIPAGVSIVESFRSRTNPRRADGFFDGYCAVGYSSFYNASGSSTQNCFIGSSFPLQNQISTSYVDTGIGINYQFTTTGTFTFSYDFVIGSTTVPTYDHLEITHDGSITLCPETLTVKACTSSTVPCPLANIVNTGVLQGNVTLSPTASGVTFSPTSFSIGGSGSTSGATANVILQATAASAGSYTLGATITSGTIPLNGTKCVVNGLAASCNLTIANTACVSKFDCIETGLTVNTTRNPLHTKLAGTAFSFDVVALTATGAVATTYTGSPTVELYDSSTAPVCSSATALSGSSQVLTMVAANNGRKTISALTLPNAYKKLACRVRDTVANVTTCSSDSFTVRPSSLTVTSATANVNGDSTNGSSTTTATYMKAGDASLPGVNNFNLNAVTGVLGYDGTPAVVPSLTEWQGAPSGGRAAPGVGTVAGAFAAALPTTGIATGSQFTYNEVGYFRFKTNGVADTTYADNSSDIANGDCTLDYSNSLVGGKYGCYFGNTNASNYFGRFVPNHFTMTSGSVLAACTAGGFTYMDQPFAVNAVVQAQNSAGIKTQNYSGTFVRSTVSPQFNNSAISATRLTLNSGATYQTWLGGAYTFQGTSITRLANPDGPYDNLLFGLQVTDSDGILLRDRNLNPGGSACTVDSSNMSNGTCTAKTILGSSPTKIRFGRARLENASGSEVLALPVNFKLEYWAGPNLGWNTNTLDVCSTVAPANFSFSFPAGSSTKPNNLAACETALSVTSLTLPTIPPSVKQNLKLSAPGAGNNGWTDLTLNLSSPAGTVCTVVGGTGPSTTSMNAPWLQFRWNGTDLSNPKARATFGIFKNANQFIYRRELH